ncbi:hypothetical protein CDAR_540571 [Caerostris darwini]|uniref:Uncharacterized protein n=1 Tax=Caerostris darwini TaxID=1538125 RepID=A0AAV4VLI4_9ARAC|nr:hypothetical protein CDAR_540571 [Caerostris darwini]
MHSNGHCSGGESLSFRMRSEENQHLSIRNIRKLFRPCDEWTLLPIEGIMDINCLQVPVERQKTMNVPTSKIILKRQLPYYAPLIYLPHSRAIDCQSPSSSPGPLNLLQHNTHSNGHCLGSESLPSWMRPEEDQHLSIRNIRKLFRRRDKWTPLPFEGDNRCQLSTSSCGEVFQKDVSPQEAKINIAPSWRYLSHSLGEGDHFDFPPAMTDDGF